MARTSGRFSRYPAVNRDVERDDVDESPVEAVPNTLFKSPEEYRAFLAASREPAEESSLLDDLLA